MYLITAMVFQNSMSMRLNPYSNGTMYLIMEKNEILNNLGSGLNPYSNGTMYLITLR